MFTVKHHECVGFESKWKVKKVSANNSCQTEFRTTETGSNTSERKSQEVQTEKTEPTQTDVDMEKLGKWLSKIYPQVKEQIDNSNNSRIFQNYRLLDDPIDATCKLVQTLQVASKGETGSQIYIWNVENDVDPLICNILAHDEYITQISWMNYIDATNSVCLASSSTDGLLKLWNFDITNNILKIKITYKIKTPVLAKMNQTTEVSEALLDKGQLGLVGFDFSKNIPDLFIVALEGGLIDEPAQVIFTKSPLNDISYIPHEEKLVAACGQHGTMEVYHLISGKSVPLSFNAKITRSNLTSLAVNSGKYHKIRSSWQQEWTITVMERSMAEY
ncbi:hypothetical protein D910_01642 [Dendroctonus ponderosae]